MAQIFNLLVEEAVKEFPDSENDLVAVDKLATKIYQELRSIEDIESPSYKRLVNKYHQLRKIYKELFNEKLEEESNYVIQA